MQTPILVAGLHTSRVTQYVQMIVIWSSITLLVRGNRGLCLRPEPPITLSDYWGLTITAGIGLILTVLGGASDDN